MALKPIIKIIQHIDQREIVGNIIKPAQLADTLLNEIKYMKPSSSVKGTIWHLLGVLSKFYD